MAEKYDSGATHPTEVLEMFKRLDFVDKERFIEMLYNEDDAEKLFEFVDKNMH